MPIKHFRILFCQHWLQAEYFFKGFAINKKKPIFLDLAGANRSFMQSEGLNQAGQLFFRFVFLSWPFCVPHFLFPQTVSLHCY